MSADERSRAVTRFGDALRAERHLRSRRRRAIGWIALLSVALTATIALPPRPRLLWNASASTPIGLYRIGALNNLATGDMVAANVPASWRALAATRRYIPLEVPLVKRIAAEPGDTVCAIGSVITINDRRIARRRRRDGYGRPMPWWRGCRVLRHGALFLLGDDPASFDGRYFGAVEHRDIIGRAWPLWTR